MNDVQTPETIRTAGSEQPPAGVAAVEAEGAADEPKLLSATLNAFDARLEQLEKSEEKTVLARFQKKASFIALMVGILLSLVSLFDVFWNKPREAHFRDMEEFNKAVNAVANLRQTMIQVHYQYKDPEMTLAMNSMVMPQVLANIQYATALLPRLGDQAGIPQLIVLIHEAMNIYDWKNAEVLVDRAVSARQAVPSLKSEALRYKARLMFFTGRLQAGRKAYEDALNALRIAPAYGSKGPQAYTVSDWILAEYSMGDCNIANDRLRQFVQLTQDPEISAAHRAGLVSMLKNQLLQLHSKNQRCDLSAHLAALN